MYNGRLKDRQDEINRLAADNHEYRDRFLAMLDKHFALDETPGKLLDSGQRDSASGDAGKSATPVEPAPKQEQRGSKPSGKPPRRR